MEAVKRINSEKIIFGTWIQANISGQTVQPQLTMVGWHNVGMKLVVASHDKLSCQLCLNVVWMVLTLCSAYKAV